MNYFCETSLSIAALHRKRVRGEREEWSGRGWEVCGGGWERWKVGDTERWTLEFHNYIP